MTLIFILLLYGLDAVSSDSAIDENFNDLSKWKELTFPKIERHSTYTIENGDDVVVIKSDNSASGIVYNEQIDIYKYSEAEWKWKIENIIKNGDAEKKSGDDYSIRIYVLFKYEKKGSGFAERLKYNTAKLLYGEYPPHSALNYIWSNKKYSKRFIENSYSDKSMMIIMESGTDNIGKWVKRKVNILADYRKVFEQDPPRYAHIAVMGDSDNTGGKSTAYIDYIIVRRPEEKKILNYDDR